jgi:enoyl-CoA hydratase/carnithine racemase
MDTVTKIWAGGKLKTEMQDGGTAVLTVNQPEKRNAMSLEMWSGLADILDTWERDEAVRVVVIAGAGEKAFVSGADISQFEQLRSNAEAQRAYDAATNTGLAKLAAFPRPIIAQIRGYCVGGGVAMAIHADLRIASDDARFSIPAARLGISYGFDRVRSLVALVGPANARMMLYTGAQMDAFEALRIGLVNRVVKSEELPQTVAALCRTLAANAPLSIRASKLMIAQALRDPADREVDAIARAGAACYESEDYREGRKAFQEKRAPNFRGV